MSAIDNARAVLADFDEHGVIFGLDVATALRELIAKHDRLTDAERVAVTTVDAIASSTGMSHQTVVDTLTAIRRPAVSEAMLDAALEEYLDGAQEIDWQRGAMRAALEAAFRVPIHTNRCPKCGATATDQTPSAFYLAHDEKCGGQLEEPTGEEQR